VGYFVVGVKWQVIAFVGQQRMHGVWFFSGLHCCVQVYLILLHCSFLTAAIGLSSKSININSMCSMFWGHLLMHFWHPLHLSESTLRKYSPDPSE